MLFTSHTLHKSADAPSHPLIAFWPFNHCFAVLRSSELVVGSDFEAGTCLYVSKPFSHYALENSERLRTCAVTGVCQVNRVVEHQSSEVLDFARAARHGVGGWRGYKMEPPYHCFDWNSDEVLRNCIQHVENPAVGTTGEDDQFSVLLDRHDDLMGEIIRRHLAVFSQIEALVPFGSGVGVEYIREDKDIG